MASQTTKCLRNQASLCLILVLGGWTGSLAPVAGAAGAMTDHWAFRPIQRPAVPEVRQTDWVRTPIDAFILARLEAAGLRPSPPADRATLFRRACFDLTGLPPTPAQLREFLDDTSDQAFTLAVDRLLDSPHYGEQWARHWLDIVRYGESNSYEEDQPKPMVWRYRDYVVRAFNEDLPYDQFLRDQLAGDEADGRTPSQVIATGFYRLGIWDSQPTDPVQARYDELDDILSTTSQAFLGLTLNCARCHDHKQDPILQRDYYRLLAFFHNLRPMQVQGDAILTWIPDAADLAAREQEVRELESRKAAVTRVIAEHESRILQAAQGEGTVEETDPERRAELIGAFLNRVLTEAEREAYEAARREREGLAQSDVQPFPQALSATESGPKSPETFILTRGNAHTPGEKVEPGFPAVLGFKDPRIPAPPRDAASSGRRTVLADWIASADNPLTARVMVNRIWQHHFGQGLVTSPNNFGLAGDPPSHPELLDWLASEFIRLDWSLKAMHRLIMSSSAYQMTSAVADPGARQDPDNRLLWRANMRRVTAEELRDAILLVNGSLNPALGGPSMYPTLPREVLETQSRPGHDWGQSSEAEQHRRSLYVHVKRSLQVPLLTAFDAADPDTSCPVRFTTTQPTQALTLLNSRFIHDEAEQFAARLLSEAGPETADQIRLGLRLALAREPDGADVDRGMRLIESLRAADGLDARQALSRFCLVLYNLNEFLYLD